MLARRRKTREITSPRQTKAPPILPRLPSAFSLHAPAVLHTNQPVRDAVRGFQDHSTPPTRIAHYHCFSQPWFGQIAAARSRAGPGNAEDSILGRTIVRVKSRTVCDGYGRNHFGFVGVIFWPGTVLRISMSFLSDIVDNSPSPPSPSPHTGRPAFSFFYHNGRTRGISPFGHYIMWPFFAPGSCLSSPTAELALITPSLLATRLGL